MLDIKPKYQSREWLNEKNLEGLSTTNIGKLCKVSRTTIGRWKSKFKIILPYQNFDWLYNQVHNLHRSDSEIATILRLKPQIIYQNRKKLGIEKYIEPKLYQNQKWLTHQIINLKKSTIEIAEICHCTNNTIIVWKNKFNIISISKTKSFKELKNILNPDRICPICNNKVPQKRNGKINQSYLFINSTMNITIHMHPVCKLNISSEESMDKINKLKKQMRMKNENDKNDIW